MGRFISGGDAFLQSAVTGNDCLWQSLYSSGASISKDGNFSTLPSRSTSAPVGPWSPSDARCGGLPACRLRSLLPPGRES